MWFERFKAQGPQIEVFNAETGSETALRRGLFNIPILDPTVFPEASVKKSEPLESWARPIPLSLLFMVALAVHLPLLLMKLPLQSYDTNFHIFFASHYVHHWFDPWNTKWFAGFCQTTYPPMPHHWIALLSRIMGLDMAYMAVQMIAILLLVVGVYRFSLLWVSPRAASIAALASVFLGSESFLVYYAGQLPTTTAAPLYLIALPFLYEWLRHGMDGPLSKPAYCLLRPLPGTI